MVRSGPASLCQIAHSWNELLGSSEDCRWMLGSRPKVIPMALGVGFRKQLPGCQIWRRRDTCSVLGPLPCQGETNAWTNSAGSSQTFPRLTCSSSGHFVRPRKGRPQGDILGFPEWNPFSCDTEQRVGKMSTLGSPRELGLNPHSSFKRWTR